MAARINRYPIQIDGEKVNIGTANELAIALDVLQGQYDRETLQQLSPHLAEVIGQASGFITVIRSLSVEDQLFLIQSIGSKLVEVIQTSGNLRDILAITSEGRVKEAILTTLGSSGLDRLIMTGQELAEVLEWVYGNQDEMLIDLLGETTVRCLCREAEALSAILHNVNFDLQGKLLEQLGWPFLLNVVRDGGDLAYLLRALPPQNSQKLLDHFSGARLIDLIGSADEWTYLYQRLEPAEAALILSKLNFYLKKEAGHAA